MDVGFTGLNYGKAPEIWSDGGLSRYKTDPVAATIAALAAVTWQGESGYSKKPLNGNYNKGVLTSVDHGRFQINSFFHPNSNGPEWGTNLAPGQAFNGNPDANITFGISILEGPYHSYGNNAAGRYPGSPGTTTNVTGTKHIISRLSCNWGIRTALEPVELPRSFWSNMRLGAMEGLSMLVTLPLALKQRKSARASPALRPPSLPR